MVTVEEKAMEYSGALERLLGAENLESVRKRIADLIVKQVEDDFRSCGEYFFYPPNYECIIDDTIASVEKRICIANRECREDKYVHRIEKSESSRNRSHLVVDLE